MATNIKVNVEEIGHILDDLRACNELLTSASKKGLEGTKKANKHCSIGYDTPIIMDHIDKELSMTIGGGILTLQTVLFKYVTTDAKNKGKADGIKDVQRIKNESNDLVKNNRENTRSNKGQEINTNSSSHVTDNCIDSDYRAKYNQYLNRQLDKEQLDKLGLNQKYGNSDVFKERLFDSSEVIRINGEKYYNGTKLNGECTTVASAQLVNNRLAYDGINANYTVDQAWQAQGNGAPGSTEKYTVAGQSYSYVVDSNPPKTLDGYMNLLVNHPEGITIYRKGSDYNHAIVLSRFTLDDNGNPKFYAYDGCNFTKKELELEKTWFSTKKFAGVPVEDLLTKEMISVGYLK